MPRKNCSRLCTKAVNSPHFAPWRKLITISGSMLSRVIDPPCGSSIKGMKLSTVASAIISAPSTNTRVLE